MFHKIIFSLFLPVLISQKSFAQVSVYKGGFFAKEFSKEIALYKAKQFIMFQVIGVTNDLIKTEVYPLAATKSGELTSLVYKCESKNMNGLVLGFYGTRWNEAGVIYTGFEFKDIPKAKAIVFLNELDKRIDDNYKYLSKDKDNNNFFYKYDDLTFLVYAEGLTYRIRVFYNDFDSEWDYESFRKTKKRFENKMN